MNPSESNDHFTEKNPVAPAPPPDRYCAVCRYAVVPTLQPRCPECGADLRQPRALRDYPRHWSEPWPMIVGLMVLIPFGLHLVMTAIPWLLHLTGQVQWLPGRPPMNPKTTNFGASLHRPLSLLLTVEAFLQFIAHAATYSFLVHALVGLRHVGRRQQIPMGCALAILVICPWFWLSDGLDRQNIFRAIFVFPRFIWNRRLESWILD